MRVDVLVAEVGSTTTLVNAFSGVFAGSGRSRLVGQGIARTTVLEGDVTAGLQEAVKSLEDSLGARLTWDSMLASSSAAGGLRMTVHGLAYEMTARAAREAALGAGAIVRMITAGPMTPRDGETLARIRPSIILLAGGVDHGERHTVVHNARVIASLRLHAPVVYAGNVAAREEVTSILHGAGLRVMPVANVYPRIDHLNVEPARRAIQRVFEERIVVAPGMEKIRDMVDGAIVPTPGAVMNAAGLLYREIGDLVVLDVGGATTDVHSVTEGSEEISKILSSPEPLAKRTVEGDLGVFVNAANVAERIGWGLLDREMGADSRSLLESMVSAGHAIPETPAETALVERLALECARVALQRHAGVVRTVAGYSGMSRIAEGKDLTRVKWVIGTGGALARLAGGRGIIGTILERVACAGAWGGQALYPSSAEVLIDNDYVMSSVGVLGLSHPEAATQILKQSLGV
ncbi:MAG: DNA mismatch repair protein MutL [Firmicutes bacterium]|nr:DNA mismatch repair protein MutL [Bacillota bacterium]